MESTKRILTKKKLLSKSNVYTITAQKNKNKQNDQNQYLSESGATTTSSVSSNAKKKYNNGNFKTPEKKDEEKITNTNYIKKMNKIYSKGIINIKDTKNKNSKGNNNNSINNEINNKQYTRSISLVNIDSNNNNINNNKSISNNNINSNSNNKQDLNNLYDKSKLGMKNKNIYIIKKNKNKNLGNKKFFPSPLSINNLDNTSNNLILYSDSENFIKTENKKLNQSLHIINNHNLTVNKNLEESYFNLENKIKEKLSPKNILNYYENNNKGYYSEFEQKKEKEKEKSGILNLEELLMTEEKLSAVINCLKDKKPCAEECFEWMNSYGQSDLILHIEKYFVKEQFIRLIKVSMNLNIFSLILSYIISLTEKSFEKFWNNLFEIMSINHRIFILICKYFSNKIMDRNIWVEKLNQLITGYDSSFKNTSQIMKEISIFCNYLINLIPNILTLYANLELISIYNSLEKISSIELISIYREKFHKNLNQNGSIFASSAYFKKNKIFEEKPQSPFLQKKLNNKKYTLVLDLDETLIHFKPNPFNESSGKIMIRPFLYDFLRSVKKYYELVIFTAATEDYANPIINAIEKDEKFFDHRLYRIHTIIVDNDFVKDLSKLGRDLNRTIIVDNMKQNYKNQPDNGITIRPFWGKDVEDTALVDLLDILKKIAENDMNVISGLKFFKEDIISKVSSNILRRAQNK